jgi:hypothetical protein
MAKADVTADKSMSAPQVDKEKASFELDLIAFFKVLEEAVFERVEVGIEANLTPDEIVESVEELFNE